MELLKIQNELETMRQEGFDSIKKLDAEIERYKDAKKWVKRKIKAIDKQLKKLKKEIKKGKVN